MKLQTIAKTATVCVTTVFITACDRTSWVMLEEDGCDAEWIDQLNQVTGDSTMEQLGKAACGAHGKSSFAGKYRCDGQKIMISCKN